MTVVPANRASRLSVRPVWWFIIVFCLIAISGCDKDEPAPRPQFPLRLIRYEVRGTSFKINFIDSNGVFQRQVTFQNNFNYAFRRGQGNTVGMSISPVTASDRVDSWRLSIDGTLYANAFSEGGAYVVIP